jgi:hypothetical protein
MYPPPHMTHKCSHTTLCTHRQAGMTHVSSSSYDTHVFSYDTGRTDKQIFLCFTSLSVTSSHHIIITHITVRTDKQVFLCYISPAHYNAISIAASQDGDGGAAEGGSGGGGSAVRATKRARGPERSRQDGGRGGGGGGPEGEDEIAKPQTKGEAGERESASKSLSADMGAHMRAHKSIPPQDSPAKLFPLSSTKRPRSRLDEAHMFHGSALVSTGVSRVSTGVSRVSMGVARGASAPGGAGCTLRRSLRRR